MKILNLFRNKDEADLRELVLDLVEDLQEKDKVIKTLLQLVNDDRNAIKDLADGIESLAQNQVIFADNFQKLGQQQRTGGQPPLPAVRPLTDSGDWN